MGIEYVPPTSASCTVSEGRVKIPMINTCLHRSNYATTTVFFYGIHFDIASYPAFLSYIFEKPVSFGEQ